MQGVLPVSGGREGTVPAETRSLCSCSPPCVAASGGRLGGRGVPAAPVPVRCHLSPLLRPDLAEQRQDPAAAPQGGVQRGRGRAAVPGRAGLQRAARRGVQQGFNLSRLSLRRGGAGERAVLK